MVNDKQINELPLASIITDGDWLPIEQSSSAKRISGSVIKNLSSDRVKKPASSPNGQNGQILRSKGNGDTEWITPATPTDAQISAALDEWMDAHPEYWASVQDGSISEEKLTSDVRKKFENGFVTPQMFGAVGNGPDDTTAFQAACDYAYQQSMGVLVYTNHYITRTIVVPSFIPIIALAGPQYRPPIITFADDIGTVFSCTVGNYFGNIKLRAKANSSGTTYTWKPVVGFNVSGNAQANADTDFIDCQINYCEYGIIGHGRNIVVLGGGFGHCRYGIKYYRDTTKSQSPSILYGYRGMMVKNVRFHGIGEEYETIDGQQVEMLVAGNSASIWLDLDGANVGASTQISDAIIESNHHDQGGTFVKGLAQFSQITNNYIKTFHGPAIDIDATNKSSAEHTVISNNFFIGCLGTDGIGVTHDAAPENMIKIKNDTFTEIKNNTFTIYSGSPIILDGCGIVGVDGNFFATLYSDDPIISSYNNSSVMTRNNYARSPSNVMLDSADDTNATLMLATGNARISYSNSSKIKYQCSNQYVVMGTYVPGANAFPYRVNDSMLRFCRINDTATIFLGMFSSNSRGANFFTSTVHTTADNCLEWLKYDHSDNSIHFMRYNLETSTLSELYQTLEVSQILA